MCDHNWKKTSYVLVGRCRLVKVGKSLMAQDERALLEMCEECGILRILERDRKDAFWPKISDEGELLA